MLFLGGAADANAADAQTDCLAIALYFEARGDTLAGQTAVASVIFNRVDDPRFPASICAVVKQGGETPPCQFSWWCDGKSDRPRELETYRLLQQRAAEWRRKRPRDRTRGALFFHHVSVNNPWRRQRERTATIGAHVFYR